MTSEEYGKIQATWQHLLQIDEHTKAVRLLLSELMAEYDAREDVAGYRRTLFRVIENDVIPFPIKPAKLDTVRPTTLEEVNRMLIELNIKLNYLHTKTKTKLRELLVY